MVETEKIVIKSRDRDYTYTYPTPPINCLVLVEHNIVMLLNPFSVPSFIRTCVISDSNYTGSVTRLCFPTSRLAWYIAWRLGLSKRIARATEQGRPLLSYYIGLRDLPGIHIHSSEAGADPVRARSAPSWGRHGCKEGCFLRPLSLPPHKAFAFACFSRSPRRQIRSPRSRWQSLHGSCFFLDSSLLMISIELWYWKFRGPSCLRLSFSCCRFNHLITSSGVVPFFSLLSPFSAFIVGIWITVESDRHRWWLGMPISKIPLRKQTNFWFTFGL